MRIDPAAEQPLDPERFGLHMLPVYDGPNSDMARDPDPDCCAEESCRARDYQRSVILTLMRLSQSYAASLLLNWQTTQVWPCDEQGHTEGCSGTDCTYALRQAQEVRRVTDRLAVVITDYYRLLTNAAMQLDGYWLELFTCEQAWFGLRAATDDDPNLPSLVEEYLDTWRDVIVDGDDEDYARWFTPPIGGRPR